MSLVAAVTIELGTAIAKSIFKLWLKDSSLGDDVSSNLIDLLKSKTTDALAQRRGQRQFETIGEKIGENLLPLFELERVRLDENERIAVAYEVATAFNKLKLSSELLALYNLEPTELAKHVLAIHPPSTATKDFSEAGTAFYKRIIEESCVYIVDIASQLPAFTEHTFAEVLKREDQLIAKTDQALKVLRQIREKLDPTAEAERFEIDYRQAVARNLDVLQLLGVDVSAANRRHRLSVAYISLSVTQKSMQQRLFQPVSYVPLKESLSLHGTVDVSSIKVDEPLEEFQDETGRDTISVEDALASSHRLLIRGLAGSGKTTLLQWVAVRSASRSFEGVLAAWNETIPFYIRLRHCIQSGLPRPENFPSFVTSAIVDEMPKGWVSSVLKSGKAIVLIDGVDEVPALKREDVRVWLKELVETYPQSRFIVTSRPHAIEEGWMDYKAFNDAELQPMRLSDIYSFIDHWHKAVRDELQEDEEKAELEPLAEHLKREVRRNRPIRNVATNPLLCAMLCALNRERRKQLPEDRIELYEACTSLLLERRDKARGIDLSDHPALNYRQKRLLVEDLAYWMIKNDWSEVAAQRADQRFERKLANMPGISQDVTGSAVRRLLLERAGMIREPMAGHIDFTHRTFQEFLAAKAAADEMDIGVLIASAHNDQWREVIILSSGLANKQMREELLMGLIDRGDREEQYRYQLHLLAVSCLETSIELGLEVQTEVEKRLSKLIPPKDMTDAQALAAAGEATVKHLTKSEYPEAITAACVRTLGLIGSNAAFKMLEGYAEDTRSTVIDELVRAWDAFDRETYAERILSRTFRDSTELHLQRLPSLDGIQFFTNITSLALLECEQVKDLTPLNGLPQLRRLDLSGCSRLISLSPLALPEIRWLSLSGCSQLHDFTQLLIMTTLIRLDLSGCSQLNDLTSMINLTSLTWLNLSGCSHLHDLASLVNLSSLTGLNLSGCSQLHGLRNTTWPSKLKDIIISREALDKVSFPQQIRVKYV